MNRINHTLLSQLLKLVDRGLVNKIIAEHGADKHRKKIGTWTHLVAMLFCHLGNAGSIRDITTGLRSATGNLRHLGVFHAPSRSSLSYMNQHRSWKVFRDIYLELLQKLTPELRTRRVSLPRLKRQIFIMDSTLVPLSLKIFNWAKYRVKKGAIKLHTVLNFRTCLPVFVHLTEGRVHDSVVANATSFPPNSIIVADRAYLDFSWLKELDSNGCYFVVRLKSNICFETIEAHYVNPDGSIRMDLDIVLTGQKASKAFKKRLRLVKVYDEERRKTFYVLTNNRYWTAETVSALYKARWDVETFFKQIKQTVRIKSFVGTTPNAVLIQVWTAMIAILLLVYLRAKAKHNWNFSNLVSFLRLNLFVKIDLWQWLDHPYLTSGKDPPTQQLYMFS